MGPPPTSRSLMYRTECSSAPCAAPTHIDALPQRSWLRWASSTLNASVDDGSPARRTSSSRTSTPSKAISDSVAAWMPMPRCRPVSETPSRSMGTTTAPIPLAPSPPGQRHHTSTPAATWARVE